ncbi:septum formation family protein [Micromonospora sp. NBC_01796]|uniref:septum formation family protein n=1 Tax=Micromonospora sp. NBC_01796 TaxID=2975987 RepID=UPI002DD7BCB8|nr:septum formation family protein [Micromonospora sp. NBC_01796]WSA86103.1 septum formation family protein [Micromonospora sp. NBC_01796]
MRRWLTAVALGGMAALVLSGCALPEGVDGDLTDDWATIGAPVSFTPPAGTCHPRPVDVGYLSSYQPVDCGQLHDAETVHVGTFSGADADRTSPPAEGSPSMRAARGECDGKANEFVGGDWRGGRLSVSVVPPSSYAWEGGARWFRCDLVETGGLDNPDVVSRYLSLKGALTTQHGLAYGCFTPKLVKDDIDQMQPVACTAKHNSEFAGIWTAPDVPYDAFRKDDARTEKGCMGVIATFTKVPNNSDLKYRTGWIFYYPSEADWDAGNRGVQCFLWIDGRSLTRSLKGAGPGALPIN